MSIRPERPEQFDAIRTLHRDAFAPSEGEAALVDALREAGDHVPELCLVGGDVEGHIFYSRASVAGASVLALAPMAVRPDRQRQGLGGELVRGSLRLAAETEFACVVVVGHPEYYPRFGFERAADVGLDCPWPVPPEAWMVHRLPAYRVEVRGLVSYPPAFAEVT